MHSFSTTGILCFVLHLTSCRSSIPPEFLQEPVDFQDVVIETKGVEVDLEGIEPPSLRTPTARSLLPTHYGIKLRPLFDPVEDEVVRYTIPGSVTISVDCVSPTQTIKLQSKLIEIKAWATKINFQGRNESLVDIESQDGSSVEGVYFIKTKTLLEFGSSYELYLEFTSTVFRDRLNGLYLSNYTNPDTNDTEYLVVTQFEPQGARQLFPGFDEPDLKAKFEMSIGRRLGYNALSNMEIRETVPILGFEGWFWDHFYPTVKMSTYLLAVVVSKFKSEAADPALFGGKAVKVWAAPHHIARGGGVFAAKTAAKILTHYESYFGMRYPLPKMDSAAIPHFDAGAMENYGLNTYREKYLMVFEGETTESERSSVCSVIAHELGHQWFGDLVTCKWWSQLWLNEGFAAFVQTIGHQAACPEFEPWSTFVSQTMQTAMQYDQSSVTHPLVNDSDTNTARFSKITYNKGASLLRMIRDFLGEPTFLKGLQLYLKNLAFSNAHQDDLFAALETSGKEDGVLTSVDPSVSEVMESWTLKKGFPLVRVSILNGTTIRLSQESFEKPKYLRDPRSDSQDGWFIPLEIKAGNTSSRIWMPSDTSAVDKADVDTRTWFIVNPEATGYYRVFYDPEILAGLYNQLEDDPDQIPANGRSQMLDDYFNFAFLNYANIKSALELTKYLDKETTYNVWMTVYTNLRRTFTLLGSTPAQTSLRAYFQPKLNAALKSTGLEQPPSEKGIKVNFRAFMLSWACAFGDADSEAYALKLFQEWMWNPATNRIPVDIQSTVYCTAIRLDSDNSIWTFVQTKYTEETGRQKLLLLSSLACSPNKTNTEKMLQDFMDASPLPNGDADAFVRKLATFEYGRDILLNMMELKGQKLGETFKVVGILNLLSSYLHRQSDYEQVQQLLKYHGGTFSLSEESTQAILQVIDDNRTWMTKFYEPIKSWMEDQISPSPRFRINPRK